MRETSGLRRLAPSRVALLLGLCVWGAAPGAAGAQPAGAPLPTPGAGSSAPEVEPNNEPDQASPLAAGGTVQGTLTKGDIDFFVLRVQGQPQLWSVEAAGEAISGLELHTISGRIPRKPAPVGTGRFTLSRLFLLPGNHWLRVHSRQAEGPYTLRAVPLGPPDPLGEREIDDDWSTARSLGFGPAQTGYLQDAGDVDIFSFHLLAPETVRLELRPPAGLAVALSLWDQIRLDSRRDVVRLQSEPGQPLGYRARLAPGGYFVEISSRGSPSEQPYTLSLERLDPFDQPADLESNDTPAQARPLPLDLIAQGAVGAYRGKDWYLLPPLGPGTQVTVTPDAAPSRGARPSVAVTLHGPDQKPLRDFRRDPASGIYTGTLASEGPFTVLVSGKGEYSFQFAFQPGPAPAALEELTLSLQLPPGPHILAAFWHQAQTLDLAATLQNQGAAPLELRLDGASSHRAWQLIFPQPSLTLAPGQSASVPVHVRVAPDAWADLPIHVTVRAATGPLGWKTATTTLLAVCGAPPVRPEPVWSVPEPLLGGLDLAWTSLGARPSDQRLAPWLFDGMTWGGKSWSASLPATVAVELAGSEPVSVAGFLLHPQNDNPIDDWIQDFDLLVSDDGKDFRKVLSGSLERFPAEQAFVLPEPVSARFVRLDARSSHGRDPKHGAIGELKVLAVPGSTSLERTGANLAAPDLGGHLVWSSPVIPEHPALLSEAAEGRWIVLDETNPTELVLGFHHQRAAQISRLELVQAPSASADISRFGQLRVSVSTASPLGPWTSLGPWKLDAAAGSTSKLELPVPVWARYLRLTNTEPEKRGRWYLPETIRVFERPVDQRYRSILGEWGHYGRDAVYERLHPPAASASAPARDDNDSREAATPLAAGQAVNGSVQVGEDEDWYRIEVPEAHNTVQLEIRGDPELNAAFGLSTATGLDMPFELAQRRDDGTLLYRAAVQPGTHFLRLHEPPRSVAFVWDNSGSVTSFRPTIDRALKRFAWDVRPGFEAVNVLPFGRQSFLRTEWSGQPVELLEALHDYDKRDGSSDAEASMLLALQGLAQRQGTRAIVLLTDAVSPGYRKTLELWRTLEQVRPRIFSFELHLGGSPFQQDLMQSWASATSGRYSAFSTIAELDVAFSRTACLIRRPAPYTLRVETLFEAPPEPARLRLVLQQALPPQGAVEIILDASGSMLQRLGGKRRIDLARDALVRLVTDSLPKGVPLALRVFGHKKPDACQTDLEVPLAPLDPARVAALIGRTEAKNLAKTPIADSLALVASDLKGSEGRALILLLTDGEETCGGDPAEAIESLKKAGFEVRVNIVGFAIDDQALKSQFQRWAEQGGGRYFDAQDGAALAAAVQQALQPKFQVLDPAGTVVATGTANDPELSLPAGRYTVRLLTAPPRLFEDVELRPAELTTLSAGTPAPAR